MIAAILSPVGRIALGAIVGVLVVIAVHLHGERTGEARCQLRVEQAIAAEQARQRQATDAALDEARKAEEQRAIDDNEMQRKVQSYEASLAGNAACALSADDVRLLLDIR